MRTEPEVLAWRILVAAFGVFLVLTSLTVYGVLWYLFQSTDTMQVELFAARGTILATPPNATEPVAVIDNRPDIEPSTLIQTDETSQAIIRFVDPHTGIPVASLVIFRDSSASIEVADAPRFGLNRAAYYVRIRCVRGQFEVLAPGTDSRDIRFEVVSEQGLTKIGTGGEFEIAVSDTGTQVTSYRGEGLISIADGDHLWNLLENQRAYVSVEPSATPAVAQAGSSLVENHDFSQQYDSGWNAYNDREPAGVVKNVIIDGRNAVMIDRAQANWPDIVLGHGETGLVQFLDRDVRDYESLEIRVTFLVEEQSLSTCGTQGSECPLMIRLKYLDLEGHPQEFIHGFYAYHDPGRAFPTICLTCRSEHERVNLGTWYTYASGNVVTLSPTDRPAILTEISFYASGWAYRTYVANVDILAERK